jgi:hypothetical protein
MQRLETEEMKALDELRNCFERFALFNPATAESVLNERADEIEKELKERYIELPLDSDGVPIRIGDKMVDNDNDEFVVIELDFKDTGNQVVGVVESIDEYTYSLYSPSKIVHCHKNRIEDMLRNIVTKARQIDVDGSPMLKESDIRELSDKLQLKEEQE